MAVRDIAPAERECRLRPGDLARIQRMAEAGARESAIARAMGVSAPTFSRWKTQDPRVAAAVQAGRDELEQELIRRVREPTIPEGVSVQQGIALMRARQFGALTLGNALFGWRTEQAQESSKVAVTIQLPAPASSVEDYRARVVAEVTPEDRRDG